MDFLKLSKTIDRNSADMDEDDVFAVKSSLKDLNYYKEPKYGMTKFPDNEMFDGIKKFQTDNKLKVDGIMKPKGETENKVNSILKKAEHSSTALKQGLSLGWSDEMHGVMGGSGYAVASMNKNWNKRGETMGEAFKRGYIKHRDISRKNIIEARTQSPTLYNVSETVGAIASPARFTKARPKAPLSIQSKINLNDNIISGIVSGIGNSENNTKSYVTNIGGSTLGGYWGHKTGNKILGRNGLTPITRSLVNTTVENGIKSTFNTFSTLNKKHNN